MPVSAGIRRPRITLSLSPVQEAAAHLAAADLFAAVLDETQRVPELASYLQEEVDLDPRPGRFILAGSANLALSASVA